MTNNEATAYAKIALLNLIKNNNYEKILELILYYHH